MAIGLVLSPLLDALPLPLPPEAMDDTTSEFNIAQRPGGRIGIAPHSHADERTTDTTQVSPPTNLALLLILDAKLVGRRPAVAPFQCLAPGNCGPKYAEPRAGDRLLYLDIDWFVGCIVVFILENLLVDVL
jgi:hypothetical protein